MKKPLLIVLSIFAAIVAVLIVLFSVNFERDPVYAYLLNVTDLLILFLIFFVIILILYSRMVSLSGNIDFSNKQTKVNLIESIIWILIVWFVVPELIRWFFTSYFLGGSVAWLSIFDSSIKFLPEVGILKWTISFFILLTIPIWSYWIIKPLYYWVKNLNKVNQKQICPFCSEKIKLSAIVCKHCGRDIESSN
tara:strand:- start:87 stop:665 length:579 start_codon:yes stop_codon:yes gene_type:complete